MRAKMADDDDTCYRGGRADIVVGFDDESYGEAQNWTELAIDRDSISTSL